MMVLGKVIVVSLLLLIIGSVWKIYEKANQPGWTSIVPVYSFLKLLEIIGKPWWWLLLMLVPIVNIVFGIKVHNLLAKSFGKDVWFAIGLIFLPFIYMTLYFTLINNFVRINNKSIIKTLF